VAQPSKAGSQLRSRPQRYGFAVALGWRRFSGFQIAEKEPIAYPNPHLEGLEDDAPGEFVFAPVKI